MTETMITVYILGTQDYDAPVSSDRAWIDDGVRTACEVFLAGRWAYWHNWTHWTPFGSVCDFADAPAGAAVPAAVRAAAARSKCFFEWLRDVRSADYARDKAAREAEAVKRGDAVEVFKGRKTPRGTYTVDAVGEGGYGEVAHLRDASGKTYRHVSLDNLRKPQAAPIDVARPAAPFAVDETLFSLALAYGRTTYHDEKERLLAVMHDAAQDAGCDEVAAVTGWATGAVAVQMPAEAC